MLAHIGKRHRAMGVNPSFFPFMGQALMPVVETYLNRKFTPAEQDAWEDVFEAVSGEIVKQILA